MFDKPPPPDSRPDGTPPNKAWRVLLVAVAGLGLTIWLVPATCSAAFRNATSPIHSSRTVRLAQFEKLAIGMSYEDAVRVLGSEGREMSRSSIMGITTVMYAWDGDGSLGANMNAMFQNNALISKAQAGLR